MTRRVHGSQMKHNARTNFGKECHTSILVNN